ncbi:DNA-dependent RNA polymerase auxiliary subunit epsilon family protein [Enterococcus sp. 669A]|uniref:DNA-directed RNA polymerase subunit epsilon n=1 Tax=Candidatus Enterococcus moelleringii TaxID=2815325 RepID=A0ABS3LFG6_9ENTE|nr:DNA-directed RNA polymerase subunit epsilon [Enterococcus sp. 669A]MBO1307471.1 DNA-dependent RNA polymerase auxiliary subunit epsilon family protein [Enterococcus sp. 669A]
MIFKVYYQESKERNPKREQTLSLYVEAKDQEEVHTLMRDNTPYNVEYIQALDGNHLAYEKENADFKLTEF